MYTSNCIINLSKNIGYLYKNKNKNNIYNLIKEYNNLDWKYYINNSNKKKYIYKDSNVNIYLNKWPSFYKISSFNRKHVNTSSFIKILKGSLLKIEYINNIPQDVQVLKHNDLLFLNNHIVYSIQNNIVNYKNKDEDNYPVSLHVDLFN